jgi:hypothetical protein
MFVLKMYVQIMSFSVLLCNVCVCYVYILKMSKKIKVKKKKNIYLKTTFFPIIELEEKGIQSRILLFAFLYCLIPSVNRYHLDRGVQVIELHY